MGTIIPSLGQETRITASLLYFVRKTSFLTLVMSLNLTSLILGILLSSQLMLGYPMVMDEDADIGPVYFARDARSFPFKRGMKRLSLADKGMMMGLGKRGTIGDRGMMMGLGKRSDAWSSQNYYGDEFY